MVNITLSEEQSLFDIALQELGSIEGAFDLAVQNDVSLTDTLPAGSSLVGNLPVLDTAVVNHYAINGIRPASGIIENNRVRIFDLTFDYSFQ